MAGTRSLATNLLRLATTNWLHWQQPIESRRNFERLENGLRPRRRWRHEAMAFETKIAANRRNAQRSTGPRTALGKVRVRRNALRHGFAAVVVGDLGVATEVDRVAAAICG